MASKGFDCATPLTPETAASFAANGYGFVARYLVPVRYSKAITKEEAVIIQAAGLKIVSVFETTEDRALGGREAGLKDGAIAAQCAEDVGQPHGTCIYFAVDCEPGSENMQAVCKYIKGCNDASPNYSTGVYGCFDVVNAVKACGAASHFWQTYAWSRAQLADCQIFQWQNGEQYDEDKSFGCEGWWGVAPANPPTPPSTSEDIGIALTIINSYMKPDWEKATAAGQKEYADYVHWLTNGLRQRYGIPVE